jgi:HAD superfamily hydrolase (TIGR01549 family)
MGGEQLVKRLLGDTVAGASDAWRKRYDEIASDVRAFPFAKEVVEGTAALGLAVALATSAPRDLLHDAIRIVGIEKIITASTSADDVASAKPDPEVFEVAMLKAGINPRRAIAIGDSVWDVQAARAAGIGCIAVESGGFSRHELAEAGAIAVYRDAEELFEQLLTSPVGRLIH